MIPRIERTRVVVTTRTGATEPGAATGWYGDGGVYVILDSGSQGTFPAGSVRIMEDKDKPREGMETKQPRRG